MRTLNTRGGEVVKFTGTKVRESSAAILWKIESDTEEPKDVWFPFSQVTEIHPDSIVVTLWIATQKGLV
jgi:hypothetical protein